MLIFALVLHALAAQTSVFAVFQKFVSRGWEHQAHVQKVLFLNDGQVDGEVADFNDVSARNDVFFLLLSLERSTLFQINYWGILVMF